LQHLFAEAVGWSRQCAADHREALAAVSHRRAAGPLPRRRSQCHRERRRGRERRYSPMVVPDGIVVSM
jgi:hypothetical protein